MERRDAHLRLVEGTSAARSSTSREPKTRVQNPRRLVAEEVYDETTETQEEVLAR